MDKEMHAGLAVAFPQDKVKTKPGRGGAPAMSYISHALVTERLNEVDPDWSLRHVATHTYLDGAGVIHCAGVTIEMTVGGVTRVESGGPQRQDGFTNEVKNAHSDALKRAAMRFGVALYIWDSLVDAEFDEDVNPEYVAPSVPTVQSRPDQVAAIISAPAPARASVPANVTPIRNAPAVQATTTRPPAAAAYPASAPRGCNTAVVVEYLRGSGFTAVTNFGSAIKEVDTWVKENFPGQPGIVGTGDWDEKYKQHKVFPSNIYDCAAYYLAQCEQPATDPAVTLAAGGIHVEDVENDEDIPF